MPFSKNLFLTLIIFICLPGCQTDKLTFSEWYLNNTKPKQVALLDTPQKHALVLNSSPLKIDSIYRSMQGPFDLVKTSINPESNELIWITGYKAELIDQSTANTSSPEFMCHNNVELLNKNQLPWKSKTLGTNYRLFTLSQGQTNIQFPKGFGIPIPANQSLEMMSQVLNHNENNPDDVVHHQMTMEFVRDSEINLPLTPLYPQTIFVTKKTSGPAGSYGLPLTCIEHQEGNDRFPTIIDTTHNCAVQFDKEDFNPYQDSYNRTFTGHWKIKPGLEVLKTTVTQMLNLEHDTKIHFISVHMHPFGESLTLRDLTTNSTLFVSKITNKENQIGLTNIDYFSSQEGIPVYANHEYELISEYRCTDTLNTHSAMATMCLYLADN